MKIKKPTEMAKKLSEAKETRKDETVTVKTKTRILKKLRSKTGITEKILLATFTNLHRDITSVALRGYFDGMERQIELLKFEKKKSIPKKRDEIKSFSRTSPKNSSKKKSNQGNSKSVDEESHSLS